MTFLDARMPKKPEKPEEPKKKLTNATTYCGSPDFDDVVTVEDFQKAADELGCDISEVYLSLATEQDWDYTNCKFHYGAYCEVENPHYEKQILSYFKAMEKYEEKLLLWEVAKKEKIRLLELEIQDLKKKE